MQTETPGQADAFVSSMGVDAHFAASNSAESTNFNVSSGALYASGIRHLRDGVSTSRGELDTIALHGIKHSVGFSIPDMSASNITSTLAAEAKNIDFVEAGNEYDNSGDVDWPADMRSAQNILYSTVKANPAFNNIAVLTPALDKPSNAALLGEVRADAGSLHNGTCDFNPATTNRSVAMAPQVQSLQADAANKPMWTTETGYDDDPLSSCYISEDGAAKYIPRTLAYRWNAGMPHSYFDFWSDENALHFAHEGFVTENGVPKKQYYAIQSLLEFLSDPGPAFNTVPLTYSIGGTTTNVMHTLLQKRNGDYDLLLWQEAVSWDHTKKIPIAVPAEQVTITFNSGAGGVIGYAYQPNYAIARTPLAGVNRTVVKINVTDAVQIVRFRAYKA